RRLHAGCASIARRTFCARYFNPTGHSGRVLDQGDVHGRAGRHATSKGLKELGCELEVFHGEFPIPDREFPPQGVACPAPRCGRLGPVQGLASRKLRIAAMVAAGCSSMSQWPAWGMTTSVTWVAAFRITTAWVA